MKLHENHPGSQIWTRWPTDGPPPFRVTAPQASDTKCMKRNFLVHSIRPATLFRESATCSISDEKIHRRVPIFSCSFSNFSRRKRPGSLKFAIVLAVIMSFAHVRGGVRFHFSLKNFFFVSHAGGRQIAECPAVLNAQIEHKYRCKPVKTVSGPYLSSPDELDSTCMRFRKRRSRLTPSQHI